MDPASRIPGLDGLNDLERRVLRAMVSRKAVAPGRRKKCARFLEDVVGASSAPPNDDVRRLLASDDPELVAFGRMTSRVPSLDEKLIRAGRGWREVPDPYVAAYAAIVDLASPFRKRHPLVDFAGAGGSAYGDVPADACYTEARVSEFGRAVLEGTAPNLLLNGAFRDERTLYFVPYRISPVIDLLTECLERGSVADAMNRHPLVPEFPTGDEVVDGLSEVQRTGAGTLRLRGRARVQDEPNPAIVITALPFGVDHALFLEEVSALGLAGPLRGALEIFDMSDRDGTRMVVAHTRQLPSHDLLDALIAGTSFEVSLTVDGLALIDGNPRTLTLVEVVERTVASLREKPNSLEALRSLRAM